MDEKSFLPYPYKFFNLPAILYESQLHLGYFKNEEEIWTIFLLILPLK